MRPKIPLRISYNGRTLSVLGLLDSGSDFIVIPRGVADDLRLKIGKKKEVGIGVGGTIKMNYSLANIVIEDKKEKHLIRRIPVHIPLSKHFGIDELIIGREPFFEEFDITFCRNSNRILLKRTKRK